MKSLIFDTSTIISLATNNLLWVLPVLKEKFGGEFYITGLVKQELIDKPLGGKKYKLEAIMISKYITDGTIRVYEDVAEEQKKLLDLTNKIYSAKGEHIKILHGAEVEALALAVKLKSDAYVVDERTMRLVIENPKNLQMLLGSKLHTKVNIDINALDIFNKAIGDTNIIRSTELMVMALEQGLLGKYLVKGVSKVDLVDGLLWGLRLRGCAISTDEINEIMALEK